MLDRAELVDREQRPLVAALLQAGPLMRLFVSITPSAEALAHLVTTAEALRTLDPRIRWSAPERLHLTLAFLGDVPPRRLAGLGGRLARAAHGGLPLRLQLRGGGRFDSAVLFARVHGDVPGLVRLAEACAAAARHSGVEVETRQFQPHLTIARSRPATGRVDLRPLVDRLADYGGPWWQADAIELVHSHLGPRPRHEALERWPLGPAPEAEPARG